MRISPSSGTYPCSCHGPQLTMYGTFKNGLAQSVTIMERSGTIKVRSGNIMEWSVTNGQEQSCKGQDRSCTAHDIASMKRSRNDYIKIMERSKRSWNGQE